MAMPDAVRSRRVLVVYATRSGCTQGVAEAIGRALAEMGAAVELAPAFEALDPSEFDAVVVGSGVRGAHWHQPARDWVVKHSASLREMSVALFTVGLEITGGPEKAEEVRSYTDALLERSGIRPIDVGLFAGWYQPDSFSFVERAVLKAMKTAEGDRRDWEAIERWASGVASGLGV
jgi:menaquinone-dependent protoporphyrinogen oxidase